MATDVVAQEVYARLSTPLLWRFLQEMPDRGDEWAANLVRRLTQRCGHQVRALWKVELSPLEAPALTRWLTGAEARLGELIRSPEDRDRHLHAVVLLVLRGDECVLTPGDDFALAPGDQLLLAGWPEARRSLQTTLVVEATMEYVISGRQVPVSWIWRRLTGYRSTQ